MFSAITLIKVNEKEELRTEIQERKGLILKLEEGLGIFSPLTEIGNKSHRR